jgi:hypothetical protein
MRPVRGRGLGLAVGAGRGSPGTLCERQPERSRTVTTEEWALALAALTVKLGGYVHLAPHELEGIDPAKLSVLASADAEGGGVVLVYDRIGADREH